MPISDVRLVDAYLRVGVSVERLPHSLELDRLISLAAPQLRLCEPLRRYVFRRLTYLRKRKLLPPLGRIGLPH